LVFPISSPECQTGGLLHITRSQCQTTTMLLFHSQILFDLEDLLEVLLTFKSTALFRLHLPPKVIIIYFFLFSLMKNKAASWCTTDTLCATSIGMTNPPVCVYPKTCDSTCSSTSYNGCFDASSTGCITCGTSYPKFYQKKCVATCPSGTFPPSGKLFCSGTFLPFCFTNVIY
jgi:hypothetical protein